MKGGLVKLFVLVLQYAFALFGVVDIHVLS